METNGTFEYLSSLDVSKKTEKKDNGKVQLTYLPWSEAWGEIMKYDPDADYIVYRNEQGWPYFTDGKTAWVEVGAIVKGRERKIMLPVMNYKNQAVPVAEITSMDVNKAIMRCLVKALALHGLALYLYQGEDLPEAAVIEQRDAIMKQAVAEIQAVKTTDEWESVWNKYAELTHDAKSEFYKVGSKMYQKFCSQ
jgi:hypothetical protein